jgi:hypothetical protein
MTSCVSASPCPIRLLLAVWFLGMGLLQYGCSSQNAVKSPDGTGGVSHQVIDAAAEEIARSLLAAQAVDLARRDVDVEEVVPLGLTLLTLQVQSDSGFWHAENDLVRLFDELEEDLLAERVFFVPSRDRNAPNFISGIEAFEEQGLDDRFNQSTGAPASIEPMQKATFGLMLSLRRAHPIGEEPRSLIRARLFDTRRRTLVFSCRVRLEAQGPDSS